MSMVQLQQGFAAGEMGFDLHFAWQQSLGPNVRFGSKADIGLSPVDVRFTPRSGHCRTTLGCPLCAISGHRLRALPCPLCHKRTFGTAAETSATRSPRRWLLSAIAVAIIAAATMAAYKAHDTTVANVPVPQVVVR